jgi:hypothetical protein
MAVYRGVPVYKDDLSINLTPLGGGPLDRDTIETDL